MQPQLNSRALHLRRRRRRLHLRRYSWIRNHSLTDQLDIGSPSGCTRLDWMDTLLPIGGCFCSR